MTEIENGDHVRLSFEGIWRDGVVDVPPYAFGGSFLSLGAASVEKIEPPVVTFKPGDVVRDKQTPDIIFSLGHDGYFDHLNAYYDNRGDDWDDYRKQWFTSEHFEKVELE